MKTRIGLSFFLCLVVTVVLVKAQDDAAETSVASETVVANVEVLNSDIAQIEDVKEEEEETDYTDYDDTVAEEETPPPPEPPAAPVEDEIVETPEDPVESIRDIETVEEVSTNDETNTGTANKTIPKSRSGNYQYDDFYGNLDAFNTDVGYNGGGDPNYNYGN
ncbi:hypothetical protein Bhyg_12830 [Pseudolycoriella hygida]|uniref:Uncharacterized protein n=1 Tax=Pseudolycoriella hygida TaxID=35572 RepID=A0A9Q0S186_9DIPT|nr:hypothetical protein Bhyg_12830 [Pseudolycoriella hygida]